ncbi:hypothetical protein ACFVFS_31140 [Kitasatospora sp. NPDC057692]|uniref:hypothetical protein n=1 Tax=Kitasatospora sp. NPDC057692 TaxID=3346215 RepID=UPI0036B2182E
MKPAHLRRIGGAVAVALTAGLFAAPAASAHGNGPQVTGTTASPQPRNLSAGTTTDACDQTTAPGWIGLTSGGPTLRADVASDTDGALSAAFAVRDLTAGTAAFDGTGQAVDGIATTAVPGLADGHAYAWNVRALQGGATSASSPDCHFKLDLTAPGATVASTDFPASGTGQTATKYAGETGAFVLTATDLAPAGGEASGIACYRYALNDTLGVVNGCAGAVTPGPDGSATLDLRVSQWGVNVLSVEAVDNAGNVSPTATHTFYAPWDPRPKPSAPGDVDGDAVPDILLPDTAGNLQVISGRADNTTPSSVIPAGLAPGIVKNWNGYQVMHRGWTNAPADDLLVRENGRDVVSSMQNQYGNGDFSRSGSTMVYWPDCTDWECPPDYGTGWQAAEQQLLIGAVNGTNQARPALLVLQNGDLWVADAGGTASYFDVRRVTSGGLWTGYDLVAPGPDAAGNLALWARERATGALHAYAIPKLADGTHDFSALADPAAGTVATGFTVGAFPTLGSQGDLDGDGAADLWAVTADRHLLTYRGLANPKDLGVLH